MGQGQLTGNALKCHREAQSCRGDRQLPRRLGEQKLLQQIGEQSPAASPEGTSSHAGIPSPRSFAVTPSWRMETPLQVDFSPSCPTSHSWTLKSSLKDSSTVPRIWSLPGRQFTLLEPFVAERVVAVALTQGSYWCVVSLVHFPEQVSAVGRLWASTMSYFKYFVRVGLLPLPA